MNFEEISTESKSLNNHKTKSESSIKLTIRGFYFTKAASEEFGLVEERYIKFLRGKYDNGKYNNFWYFVVTDSEKDFKISQSSHNAKCVFNKSMLRLFTTSLNKKVGDSFYLQDTKTELNGNKVIEILVNKSVQEINKNG